MRVTLDLSKRDIQLATKLFYGHAHSLRMRARSALAPRIFLPSLRARTIKEKEVLQRKKARKLKREAGTFQRIGKAFEKYLDR